MTENNKQLAEKLRRWMTPHPAHYSPTQLAGLALSLKTKFENDSFLTEKYPREKNLLLHVLDTMLTQLYLVHTNNPKGPQKERLQFNKKIQESYAKHSKLEENEQLKEFNKISTPGKRNFLKRAKNTAKNKDFSIAKFNDHIALALHRGNASFTPQLRNGIDRDVNIINGILNTIAHPDFVKEGLEMSVLQDGPKSVEDIHLLVSIFVLEHIKDRSPAIFDFDPLKHHKMADQAIVNILTHLEEIQNDVPRKKLVENINNKAATLKEVAKTHSFGEENLFSYLRYFLQHNEEKLPAQSYAHLSDCMETWFISKASFLYDQNPEMAPDRSPEAMQNMFDTVRNRYHIDYPKPSIKETLSDLKELSSKSNKQLRAFNELDELLQQCPEGIKPIVIHHHVEAPFVKKLRQSAFKAKWTPDGGDGPKRAFIKDIAENQSDDLRDLGFSSAEINNMYETGKLPENCGYNIEHIIDREHGGTNHDHNFILMPEEINTAKDRLKSLQKSLYPNADEGCWIISWVPEKNDDGTYPKIFKGHLNDGNVIPSQTWDDGLATTSYADTSNESHLNL